MLIAVAALAAAQECPKAGLEQIRAGTTALYEAYAQVDTKAFDAASVVINHGIGCVDSQLETHTIVELHRTMAIIAFAAGQQAPSRKSWMAARTLDPAWELPSDLYPPNHPVRVLFESATPGPATLEKLDSRGGKWLVDGLPAAVVPLDRAFVLQALDERGAVRFTGYLWSILDVPALQVPGEPGLHTSVVRLSTSLFGGALVAGQQTGEIAGFGDRTDTAPVAGARLRGRLSPVRFAAIDASLTGLLNADAANGGGSATEARAAAVLGWDARSDARRTRVGVRAGIAWEGLRAWSGLDADPTTERFLAPNWSLGAELDTATASEAFHLAVEPSFLLAGGPWQLRSEASWTHRITPHLALEGGLEAGVPLETYDIDSADGTRLASRRDTALRAGFGFVVFR